mmetsp:Transcript_41587/g.50448  ORF Transcript_41587/g.50448 Transcript_41587/m.50448 type:complete len:129 (-) Transcript_41587:541-927(-)
MSAAPAPNRRPKKRPAAPPVDLGRDLRCCMHCRLLKTYDQFLQQGCDNCVFLGMKEDGERVNDCTTSNFSGMIASADPSGSWAVKWMRLGKYVPGCYALAVHEELQEHIQGILEDNGYTYHPPEQTEL